MLKRLLTALPAALLATTAIILSMHALVAQGEPAMTEAGPKILIGFAPEMDDSDVRKTDLIEPIDIPAPARVPENRREISRDTLSTGHRTRVIRPDVGNDTLKTSMPSDSPLVIMMRPRPEFPSSMAARGISGYVDVVFDVLPSGSVVNVEVLASSHKGFERAAVRAAERFRFKAAMVDGVAQPTSGVRYRFRFDMDN